MMDEKEFLEEHPNLKGNIKTEVVGLGIRPIQVDPHVCLNHIHETQIDKQKVKRIIEKYVRSLELQGKIKKDLGLKEPERHCDSCKSILTKEIIKGKERLVCPKGHAHPTGDFSYLCGSDYCRCCQ